MGVKLTRIIAPLLPQYYKLLTINIERIPSHTTDTINVKPRNSGAFLFQPEFTRLLQGFNTSLIIRTLHYTSAHIR